MARHSLRLGAVAVMFAFLTGTPSVAQTTSARGGATGRLLVYFHQEQRDSRQVQFFCRRQIQEEITGHVWGEKYPYDALEWTPPPPPGPSLPGQGPQKRSYLYQRYPDAGQPYFFSQYTGWYEINGVNFGASGQELPLKSALRSITYNGPPSSYVGPECTARGPTPIIDGWVEGTVAEGGGVTKTLRCQYHDGTSERIGVDVTIVLHGRCTITTRNGDQTSQTSAPVREVRKMAQGENATWPGDPSRGNCWGGRPGTGFGGPGECPYFLSTTVTHDA